MTYILGVDLGTTYSAAAIARDGRVETFTLGASAPAIPSVVVLRQDGEVLTGEAAERRALSEPSRTAREFKRRLGDPTPIVIGGTPYGAEALMAHLLRAIVAQVTEREGASPDQVILTHPANYGPFKLELMRETARLAGLDLAKVSLMSEPEAAAVTYARQQRVETGEVVAAYDFGGGTFDAAVVRKTDRGFEILGTPEGMERLGGIDFDAAVLAHVDASLQGKLAALDGSDPNVRSALARLRDECRRAKEALSTDTDTTIHVSLPDLQSDVRLTRGELEGMIRPRIRETVQALERAVTSSGVRMSDVSRILLVGGTSRIPLIGEIIHEATGRPVALDTHPKFAIANGAALAADALRNQSEPAPAGAAAASASAPPQAPPTAVPAEPTASAPPAPGKKGIGILPLAAAGVVLLAVVGGVLLALQGSSDSPGNSASQGPGSSPAATSPAGAAGTQQATGTTPSSGGASGSVSGGGKVSIVAGISGSNDARAGEGGPATSAALNLAEEVAVAPNGDIYIADRNSSRLLRISGGTLTVVYRGDFSIGENDVSGIAVGRDGSTYFTTGLGVRRVQADGSTSLFFSHGAESDQAGEPKLATSPDGTLYYSTGRTNPQVFRVAADGKLTAFAGTGNPAAQTVIGDGGPAVSAQFSRVSDLAVDSKGALYIADEGQGVVRKVDSSGVIRTVVGGGTVDLRTMRDPSVRPKATELKLANGELGIAFDSADRMYISSAANALIMRVAADGTVSLVAGGGRNVDPGLPALETAIAMPSRLAIEPSGDLLVLVESGRFLWRIAGAAK